MKTKELWKPVEGYEALYKVSSNGRIRSLPRLVKCRGGKLRRSFPRILKPVKNCYGYMVVTLNKNGAGAQFRVHRLVAKAFVPNPENKPQINHKDTNKQNNQCSNLEWVTQSENAIHALESGISTRGDRNGRCKIPTREMPKIKERIRNGETQRSLAKEYGVSTVIIGKIWRGTRKEYPEFLEGAVHDK
jgi:NUMOD4 motif/HNH endonuclease